MSLPTVSITSLPAAGVHAAGMQRRRPCAVEGPPATRQVSDRSFRAVVIEDDADIRGLVVLLLSQAGFVAHEAVNGAQGIALVEQHRPQLVTVDIGLPDLDGTEVNRRLRIFSDAYILMLTARAEAAEAVRSLASGADDYLAKPFKPEELRARAAAVRNGRLRQPGAALSRVAGEALRLPA
ncbi:response regulator transcription factor [Paenarthrobacter sp. DKR-5]|uniref:response regulator transcription factor n=1 Tax=Paenarthrobacter sp. DKR-5 TaxID=2835535 RepID=UPI002028B10D|nr:response regulator [Paenarthrobacter sp. DKR-5]